MKESETVYFDDATGLIKREDRSTVSNISAPNQALFVVTKSFGKSLSNYFSSSNQVKLTLPTIYKLAMQILDLLEIVHTAGYVHNDISLKRLMLGYGEKIVYEKKCSECRSFKQKSLHLDDFSFATPYLDLTTGKHLKKGKADNAAINASNQMHSLRKLNCERTCRKDDLFMLVSLLLTLCNNYSLPDFQMLNKQ